ncbi:GNAT family N-acetyltransferase [Amycolatopsis anabasis]|uniref:GNAT family N-acetyltransferase n=1 Tax=Amycolatopsis anabasis TaxID=1840409 RepID=UPI00131B0048|nr:GNAT family protein [Amycolatopsis anabasis]
MLYPHTKSRRTVLRPTTTANSETFYKTLLRAGIESLPPMDSIAEDFACLDALFLVERRDNGEVLGYSTLHRSNTAGHIEMGLYTDTTRARYGIGGEAVVLTINYAFATLNIDKMIVRTTEASFAGLGEALDNEGLEGVLPGHLYFRGNLWDLHCYAMRRAEWEEYMHHVGPVLGAR